MEFVVDVLVSVFNKSSEEATSLMLYIHEHGSAVIGKYTYDIAVSRTNLARSLAKKNGFPLRVEIE
jgi:ATP-dependent Clp protease adaptor protein ClpS